LEEKISFTVPIRTVSEANNSDHWSVKRKRRRDNEFFVSQYFNTNTQSKKVSLPCRVILTRIAPLELDYDNLVFSFKGIRDCIADKLIPDLAAGRADGDRRISWDYSQEKGSPGQYAIRVDILPSNPYFPS
jgi:hypothetical protein